MAILFKKVGTNFLEFIPLLLLFFISLNGNSIIDFNFFSINVHYILVYYWVKTTRFFRLWFYFFIRHNFRCNFWFSNWVYISIFVGSGYSGNLRESRNSKNIARKWLGEFFACFAISKFLLLYGVTFFRISNRLYLFNKKFFFYIYFLSCSMVYFLFYFKYYEEQLNVTATKYFSK